ncbi:MAG: ABC transporter ATP-binding protein [Clostridiales bacterium]|nr:ABC transporter ATP-binding protein [Clostridiales bacterium]
MITAKDLTKKFDSFTALNSLNCSIPEGCIYGMVGSNGAGKSTLLRLISGIYRADGGSVEIDGKNVYDDPEVKNRLVFVPDELYFLPRANLIRMARLYASVYERFSYDKFKNLVRTFKLSPTANIGTFSKGMKRQAATILALSCNADFILFDETFDGLDPVMRNLVKNLLYDDVMERKATAVITSHSLRELEDTCDQLSLLHKGGIIFESDIGNLKTSLFKVQVAFSGEYDRSKFQGVDMLSFTKHGSVSSLIVRGDREETAAKIKAMDPILFEILPLSLEEVFVYEMDALGYEFSEVLKQEVE